jgi:hypothetical protein
MTDLVVGIGEVGEALANVLETRYEVVRYDPYRAKFATVWPPGSYDYVHLCYPYDPEFEAQAMQWLGKAGTLIVHSTVPVGTTRKLGPNAVHSPVHGVHPRLEDGLRTFSKYVGGVDFDRAYHAASHMLEAGILALLVNNPEEAELSKLFCTLQYGFSIMLCKEARKLAERYGADFETIYTEANENYNKSYKALGKANVIRPVLVPEPGKIGGHCVVRNAELLGGPLSQFLLDWNSQQ